MSRNHVIADRSLRALRQLRTEMLRGTGLHAHLEVALPAQLMALMCAVMVGSKKTPPATREAASRNLQVFEGAVIEALADLPPARNRQAGALLTLLGRYVLLPMCDRPIDGPLLTLIHWLNGLVEEGVVTIPGGPVLDALQHYVDQLNTTPDEVRGQERATSKRTRRILEDLRGLGLYRVAAEAGRDAA